MSQTLHLTVTGMTCGGCENAVTRALQQLEGVQEVTASHVSGLVGVTFDKAKVSPQVIRDRIETLGYGIAP